MKRGWLASLALAFFVFGAAALSVPAGETSQARLWMPPVFGNHMVLQQGLDLPVWGRAPAGTEVKVMLRRAGDDAVSVTAKADADGRWRTTLPPRKAGKEACVLEAVCGDDTLTFADVLIGEVWLASGQSNMEWTVGASLNAETEIEDADNYGVIREFRAPRTPAILPPSQPGGDWVVCTSQTASRFSAAGYFFARDLVRKHGFAVGILNTAWGGMPIQPYMSPDAFAADPAYEKYVKLIAEERAKATPKDDATRERWLALQADYDRRYVECMNHRGQLNDREKALTLPDDKDADWPTTSLPGFIEKIKGFESYNGYFWYRKTVTIPPEWSGKELVLYLPAIDDDDVTFFNGKQVGLTYGYDRARAYPIPSELVKAGAATLVIRGFDYFMGGGLYGKTRFELAPAGAPEGKGIALAGDWKYRMAGGESPEFPQRHPDLPGAVNERVPSALWTGMVEPFVPYAVRGAIWYQGESNSAGWKEYRKLFPDMIKDWRKHWGYDLAFLWCQLANHKEPQTQAADTSPWPFLREAQTMALALPATGQAVLTDNADPGNPNDIHPKNKQDVGLRLSLLARRLCYGEKDLPAASPMFKSMDVADGKLTVTFDQPVRARPGAAPTGQGLGFALAGKDGGYVWADTCVVAGDKVTLSHHDLAAPVSVRYAWASNPVANLVGREGLPVCPFRAGETDQ